MKIAEMNISRYFAVWHFTQIYLARGKFLSFAMIYCAITDR